jgi:hypothetical protein
MTKALPSISEVTTALGGIQAVADLTGRTYSAAAQDNRLGKFPAHTYLVMTDALAALGKSAPASLWGMTAPQERETAEPARWPS